MPITMPSWTIGGKMQKLRDNDNYELLRSLKFREYGFRPDELAGELHEQVLEIVNCSHCANCCEVTHATINEDDVERISGHLNMTRADFIETYWEPDDAPGAYMSRKRPCPFLGEDNRCAIYEMRPAVCREYPHTDKEGLVFRTMGVANNTLACPVTF